MAGGGFNLSNPSTWGQVGGSFQPEAGNGSNYQFAPGSAQYQALQQALLAKYAPAAAAPAAGPAAPAANYNYAPGSSQYTAMQQALTAKYGGGNTDVYGRWQNAPGQPFQLQPASAGGLDPSKSSDPGFTAQLQQQALGVMATPGNHLTDGSQGHYATFGPFNAQNPSYSGRWGPTWYPSDGVPLPPPSKWEIDPFTGLPHDPRSGGSVTPDEWAINDANPASPNYNPRIFGAGGGPAAAPAGPVAGQDPTYAYAGSSYTQPSAYTASDSGGAAGGTAPNRAAIIADGGLPPASTATAPVTAAVNGAPGTTTAGSMPGPAPDLTAAGPPQDQGTVPTLGQNGQALAGTLAGQGSSGIAPVTDQSQQSLLAKKLAQGWQGGGWSQPATS